MLNQQLARMLVPSELEIIKMYRTSGRSYQIEATKRSKQEVCRRCASLCKSIYDHRWVSLRDEPVRGKLIFLKVLKKAVLLQTLPQALYRAFAWSFTR